MYYKGKKKWWYAMYVTRCHTKITWQNGRAMKTRGRHRMFNVYDARVETATRLSVEWQLKCKWTFMENGTFFFYFYLFQLCESLYARYVLEAIFFYLSCLFFRWQFFFLFLSFSRTTFSRRSNFVESIEIADFLFSLHSRNFFFFLPQIKLL